MRRNELPKLSGRQCLNEVMCHGLTGQFRNYEAVLPRDNNKKSAATSAPEISVANLRSDVFHLASQLD